MAMSRRTRGWVWLGLAIVLAVALMVGAVRGRSPSSNSQRIDAIAKTIKCPSCRSESVFESKAPSAEAIRNEIARQVGQGRSDAEVRAYISNRFGGDLLLVPSTTGISSLVWILPVVAIVLALAGLAMAFRRWRLAAAGQAGPTDEDRALVAAALAAEHEAHGPNGDGVDGHGEGTGR